MVQAEQQGRKDRTRRTKGLEEINKNPDYYIWLKDYNQMEIPKKAIPFDDKFYYAFTGKHNNSTLVIVDCPYGKPGDILWVRETFYAFGKWVKNGTTKTGKQKYKFIDCTMNNKLRYEYPDTIEKNINPLGISTKKNNQLRWYKRSALFMPKKACRTFLKVKSGRPERLQEISQNDCVHEGIEQLLMSSMQKLMAGSERFRNYLKKPTIFNEALKPYESFKSLWISINGPDSWNKNPWVWVIEFERTKRPANFLN